jgi:hypothetical protein
MRSPWSEDHIGNFAKVRVASSNLVARSKQKCRSAPVFRSAVEPRASHSTVDSGRLRQSCLTFKGATLRSILLNAYGWWTAVQIRLFAGIGMVIAGLVLAVLTALGVRHAPSVATST